MCNSEISKFSKQQEASRLLSSLGIKTPSSKIPLIGLFCFNSIKQVNTRYKTNEKAVDKFMPQIHLKQLKFAYSACKPFTKSKEKIQKFK